MALDLYAKGSEVCILYHVHVKEQEAGNRKQETGNRKQGAGPCTQEDILDAASNCTISYIHIYNYNYNYIYNYNRFVHVAVGNHKLRDGMFMRSRKTRRSEDQGEQYYITVGVGI